MRLTSGRYSASDSPVVWVKNSGRNTNSPNSPSAALHGPDFSLSAHRLHVS
ncbi:hypothetical protein A8924_5252 [Saccharopolyspora erythraea NRRL 2338]|nr:hypothetical protein A8924_5252 [Saccharopolyspora erythraea NRRL 2338]